MTVSFFTRPITMVLCGALVLILTSLAGASATAQSQGGNVLCSGLPCTVGLTIDKRGNLYTAEPSTGHVFCIPPDTSPILLAKVTGRPTAVAVDRLRNVFVGTESGVIYLVTLDGSVSKAHTLGCSPVSIVIDRDGGLIIATNDGQIVTVKRSDLVIQQ